jgi:hypothetical protein
MGKTRRRRQWVRRLPDGSSVVTVTLTLDDMIKAYAVAEPHFDEIGEALEELSDNPGRLMFLVVLAMAVIEHAEACGFDNDLVPRILNHVWEGHKLFRWHVRPREAS